MWVVGATARDGGRALVCAGGGALVVAVLELRDLVVDPAFDAARARGRAVGGGGGFAVEGNEGREGWWGQLVVGFCVSFMAGK